MSPAASFNHMLNMGSLDYMVDEIIAIDSYDVGFGAGAGAGDYDDDDGDGDGDEGFVESNPSGRYWRYPQVLGKGATKTVYKAFDKLDCTEVAWCKAVLPQAPASALDHHTKALLQEIQILKDIDHDGILKVFASWVNTSDNSINFITELCSSSLMSYRMLHKHVSRRAITSWARQILLALAHLHSQQPPIIHRDLKCDNILVKSSSTMCLKIADFGSAAQLAPSSHMCTLVGTPEFMAPEMFQEDYNELTDVYSFGMCMIQLITREYPYTECKQISEIYKNVINNVKPKALFRIKDKEVLRFINRCILPVSERPSAIELLSDLFLKCQEESRDAETSYQSLVTGRRAVQDIAASLESTIGDSHSVPRLAKPEKMGRFRVMGKVVDKQTVRLKLRIQTSSTNRDIVFPFDLRNDSPRGVAEEMVRALNYPEADLVCIANLIKEEVTALSNGLNLVSLGSYNAGVVMDSYVHPHQNKELMTCQTVGCA